MINTFAHAMPLAVIWGWVAAAGAAGSVPIVIHLLNRFRFRRISWAAMDFLLRALEKNRRRLRTENLLLLVVRVLMVMLFALALANITFSCDSRPGILAGRPRLRVLMIDDSLSTGYDLGNNETVLSRSKTVGLGLLRNLGNRDRAHVVRVNARGIPLTERPLSLQHEYLRLVNDDFHQPSHRGTDYTRALADVFTMLKDLDGDDANVAPHIVLLGDMQRSGIVRNGRLLSEEFVSLARELDFPGLKVFLQTFGPAEPENTAVASFETGQTKVVAVGMQTEFEAHVVNYGNQTLERVEAALHIAGPQGEVTTRQTFIESLPPMSPQRVVIRHTFRQTGHHKARFSVDAPGDFLSLDNERFLAVPVSEGTRILIVDGSPFDDSAFLLRKTFLPEVDRRGVEPGARIFETVPEVVDAAQFNRDDFSLRPYQVIVLANVRELSTARLNRLRTYVEEGGQLLVFPGPRIDRDWYNIAFYDDGNGLLPARLDPETAAFSPDGIHYPGLELTDATHPTLNWMRQLELTWRGSQIYRYFQLDVPLAAYGAADGEDAPDRPAATVLATLGGSAELPAIVERRFGPGGKGHVVLFAFPAGVSEWHNLPRTLAHPLFLFRMVEDIVEPPINAMNLPLDEPLVRPLEVGEFMQQVSVANPLGDIVEFRPDRSAGEGSATLEYRQTRWAGFYEIDSDMPSEPTFLFAVNVEPAVEGDAAISGESDLRKIDIEELRELAPGIDFVWSDDPQTLYAALAEASRATALFRELLIAVLALTLLESLMAWRFGRFK